MTCAHHWIIDSDQEYSGSECRDCGATKEFNNRPVNRFTPEAQEAAWNARETESAVDRYFGGGNMTNSDRIAATRAFDGGRLSGTERGPSMRPVRK